MSSIMITGREPVFFALVCGFFWTLELLLTHSPVLEKTRHTYLNLALFSGKALIQVFLGYLVVSLAVWSRLHRIGLLAWLDLPEPVQCIVGFVLLDLGGYWLHRLSHSIPLVWRFHRVHHTDPVVDVSTYFRTHPGEAVISWVWFLGVVLALGPSPRLLGVNIAVTVLSALLQHADLSLPAWLEKPLRYVWITAELHKIHHSRDRIETDSNYSPLLSVWDRAFGSFRGTPKEQLKFGLDEFATPRWLTLSGMLITPFSRAGIYTRAKDMPIVQI